MTGPGVGSLSDLNDLVSLPLGAGTQLVELAGSVISDSHRLRAGIPGADLGCGAPVGQRGLREYLVAASLAAWTRVSTSARARSIASCACAVAWRTRSPASPVAAALSASACCAAASHRLHSVLRDVYDMLGPPFDECSVESARGEVAGLHATDLIDSLVQSCAC